MTDTLGTGAGTAVSNLPARNRNFSGRGHLLDQIHDDLRTVSAAAAVVPTEAVHGLGGIGKTDLAAEYAHRFGSDYDIAWWVPAEEPTAAAAALAGLAKRLGIPEAADRSGWSPGCSTCSAAGAGGCWSMTTRSDPSTCPVCCRPAAVGMCW